MPVRTEAPVVQEAEAKREMGERAYNATTELVENLLGTPEFLVALGTTFFGRSFPNGGRTDIADGVFFRKGGFGYSVKYHAEPRRYLKDPEHDAEVSLTIDKYDPRQKNYNGDGIKNVGAVWLTSHFREKDGEVVAFKSGYARVQDDSGEHKDLDAFDKIQNVVGDLSPKPVKL